MKPYVILIFFWLALVYLVAGLAGCKQMEPVPQASVQVLPKVIPTLAWGDKHPDWTEHLLEEIAKSKMLDVIPSDAKGFCPSYAKLTKSQRAEVLAQLISIMAKRESNFKPETKFTEAFNDAKGRKVISRGLLQISIESANSYGCGFKNAEELHDPKKNLSCGVKIIERWVQRDGQAMGTKGKNLGCGRYWSVCRASSRSYPVVRGYVSALPICK